MSDNFTTILAPLFFAGQECAGYIHQCYEKAYERTVPLTMYPDDPFFIYLCPTCKEEYITYWTERWDEYTGGLL